MSTTDTTTMILRSADNGLARYEVGDLFNGRDGIGTIVSFSADHVAVRQCRRLDDGTREYVTDLYPITGPDSIRRPD